jgi:hypothetical protein
MPDGDRCVDITTGLRNITQPGQPDARPWLGVVSGPGPPRRCHSFMPAGSTAALLRQTGVFPIRQVFPPRDLVTIARSPAKPHKMPCIIRGLAVGTQIATLGQTVGMVCHTSRAASEPGSGTACSTAWRRHRDRFTNLHRHNGHTKWNSTRITTSA